MTGQAASAPAEELVRPLERRRASASSRLTVLRRLVAPLLLAGLWAVATSAGWVDPSVLPSPSAVGAAIQRLWTEQSLPAQVGVSLGRALTGGVFGVTLGLVLGLGAGLSKLGEEAYDAFMQMLRTVPFLALVPLFIVWFGIGETPKLLLIALATTFPMYLNTSAGVRNVDRKVIEAMRSFGLSGPRLVVQIVLPLAMPSILSGLRLSLGVSVLVLIAAEQINTSSGLGYLLNTAQMYQQVDVILICVAIYAVLGLSADLVVRALERVLMPWRASVAVR